MAGPGKKLKQQAEYRPAVFIGRSMDPGRLSQGAEVLISGRASS